MNLSPGGSTIADIPYLSTNVSPERSQQRIMALLAKFGVSDLGFGMADPAVVELRFTHEGIHVRIPFSAQAFADAYRREHPNTRKSRDELLEMARRATWRFAEAWLKTMLEAVEYGLLGLSDVFLPHYADASGQRLGPLVQAFLGSLDERGKRELAFQHLVPALPEPVIDTEWEEVPERDD